MLEIFCAIYPEAKILIQKYALKKENTTDHWDHFINQQQTIRLTITGEGKVNVTGAVCATLMQDREPFVLSFGSAAFLKEQHEKLYIASCIADIDTGIAYYPDLFLQNRIQETVFLTGSRLLTSSARSRATLEPPFCLGTYLEKMSEEGNFLLYDMESSAIYEAANWFVGPHAMVFLRFATDKDASLVTAEMVYQKSEEVFQEVDALIQNILKSKKTGFVVDDVTELKEKIHASRSVSAQIDQVVHYCMVAGIDYHSVIDDLMKTEVKEKEQGKQVLDAFIRRCCES